MTSSDWPTIDSTAVPMPASVSSHDLFGGDLFGDELMDIYNSEAVVEDGSAGVVSSEIPSLPNQIQDGAETQVGEFCDHPGAQIALNAAVMDDGLGAFRPSTSFNDLTALLNPESTMESPAPVPAEANDPAYKPKQEGSKKRTPTTARDGPAKKKMTTKSNASPTTKRSITSVKPKHVPACPKTTSVEQIAAKSKQETAVKNSRSGKNNNTPNPLTGAAKVTQVISAPVAVVSPKAPINTVSSAVVSAVPPPPPASGKGTGMATEADFKSVAEAAVTNLILNAGSTKIDNDVGPGIDEATGFPKKVDTSTAHIKALTSSNWVAACGDGSAAATAAAVAVAADSKANNRARRQNLTPDERARQNRDRNREHARNTRLRKKAYVEELKRTLKELVAQRDAAEVEKRHNAQRELEQREVRFRVMEEFLKLRGRNEANFARWAAILEESFTLTLPSTDFRTTVHTNKARRVSIDATEALSRSSEQSLSGVTEVMSDSSKVSALLQTLGNPSNLDTTLSVVMYQCDRANFFMDGVNAVLEWSATSVGAVRKGAPAELSFKGTMHAHFSPASNKLLSAKIMFDTGFVSSQLQQLVVSSPAELPSAALDACDADVAAAQAAANEAENLLDSLQMPQLSAAVPSSITVVPSTTVSITSSEKGESDSEDNEEVAVN